MIRLFDRGSSAEIALLGAELRAWTVESVPLLWTPDPAVWSDIAPLLFPVVGWTRGHKIWVGQQDYPLGLHGFVRHQSFRVLEHWPTHVRLGLAASDETRALFPFDWEFEVQYTLAGATLDVRLLIRNRGDGPMPYACGLHPGFRWPFAGGAQEEYEILFAEREGSSVPVISPDGLLTRQSRRVPIDGRRLRLSSPLFEQEALCFLEARSRGVRFAHSSGAAIDILLEDFSHLALWSRPPAPFLSIEAWTGHGDYVDATGDLFAKPSMRHLAPKATARHIAKFTFVEAHAPILGLA